MAVSIIGNGCEVPDSEKKTLKGVYLEKQSHMKEFLASPSTALVKVDV
ncbi:MAG: hypothetical protein QG577_2338, partial [Thermodesulfobacteriota bacterium]|nr:hypothetical protein [Thermodesulfobacteriota bacterium]